MKAIIISDSDARALLDKLELAKMRESGHFSRSNAEAQNAFSEAHRAFHYVVCKWLQEQGADTVNR
jgi:hypothetical protein